MPKYNCLVYPNRAGGSVSFLCTDHDDNPAVMFTSVQALPQWVQDHMAVLDMLELRVTLIGIGSRHSLTSGASIYHIHDENEGITCITTNQQPTVPSV